MYIPIRKLFPTLILALGLAGCGGGGGGGGNGGEGTGYDGATDPATVTQDNSDDLTLTAVSGIRGAVNEEYIPDEVPGNSSSPAGRIDWQRLAFRITNRLVDGFCSSGSLDVTTTPNDSGTGETSVLVFNDCTYEHIGSGETINIDGTVEIVRNSTNGRSATVRNLTLVTSTYGTVEVVYYHIECSTGDITSCTWSADITGIDGRTYRIEDADISGIATLDGSLTVYDPDYGSVDVTVNGMLFECTTTTGVPSAGSITITGEGGSLASVEFNDCNSFTVTVDGTATTYQWADVLGGG